MKKVLIVDDEKSSIDILKYLIAENSMPFTIIGEVTSGREAIELVIKSEPDILFIDIEMPGISGLEVIHYLKENYKKNLSVIIITAYNEFEYAQKALQLGAKDILLKPINFNSLNDAISRAIGYQLTDNSLLNNILEYLEIHFTDDISISELSQTFFTTPGNITKLFKKYLHVSYTEYINQKRIQASKLLLKQGASIKEAAEKSGYNNLNYFYKNFKKYVGTTPKKYL